MRIGWLLGCFFLVAAPVAGAAPKTQVATSSSAIVAVVNDEAITAYDLNARIKFVLATTNLSNAPEALARIKPQIIRALIDERLQLQEARRNNIKLEEKEVAQAIAGIEAQREMPPGSVMAMMTRQNIPPETLLSQIKAQIVWGKLIQRKLRPQIRITDEEVEAMARRLSEPVRQQELHIGILQLPVDKPSRDKEVRQAAEKLVLEVRGGANFEEVARQFAGGAVREGGKLPSFWVRPADLDPIIAKSLVGAQKGDISAPLRNAMGYTIIKVYDTRDLPGQPALGTEIIFKEIALRLRSSTDKKEMDDLKAVADEVAAQPGGCEEKTAPEIKDQSVASIEVQKTTQMLSDLPAALRVVAEGMKLGELSSPFATEEGLTLYMLCGKREGVKAVVDTQRAKAAAMQQRMELEAQKYMRNLRRDGFIEVRG